MLRASRLVRHYGTRCALERVSLAVSPGEIVGVLGANGAGKSTLMRLLAGVLLPDSGSVEVDGVALASDPVAAKQRMGFAPEEPSLYAELDAMHYLEFIGAVRGLEPREARARALGLLDRLGLSSRAGEPAGQLSHGMRKKLSFAAATLARPALLLCDEALEGFDVGASFAAKQELVALARAGCAVLFSSHVTETVERLCDRVLVLHEGRLVRSLERAQWGGEPGHVSPLEQMYIESIRPRPAVEEVS
jgi:ABC-2 type transport system ATP-binding protein